MCDGTLLPHCGHLFSCEACQRFAAFRVRNRIFDVLRFGTPIAGAYQSITTQENNNRRSFRAKSRNPVALQTVSLRDPSAPLRSAQDDTASRLNCLTSVCPTRSNPIFASRPALLF